jgi:hypothetical protein
VGRVELFAEGSLPVLNNNLYYNGGQPIPTEDTDVLVPAADSAAIPGDPRLGDPNKDLVLPRWDAQQQRFLSGQRTIHGEFERLVHQYATPAEGSPAIANADPADMPTDDILGQPRGEQPTVGAVEVRGER